GRMALWLGPDEWLIIDESGRDPLADCAKAKQLHSAVGISHRNVAIAVEGPAAAAYINAGCPQDLSLVAFPVGACSRTVFGKAEIVLYRTAEDVFRVECWRSFSDSTLTYLSEAARDAAAWFMLSRCLPEGCRQVSLLTNCRHHARVSTRGFARCRRPSQGAGNDGDRPPTSG